MTPKTALYLLTRATHKARSQNLDQLYLAKALASRVLSEGGPIYQQSHDQIHATADKGIPPAWVRFWDGFSSKQEAPNAQA